MSDVESMRFARSRVQEFSDEVMNAHQHAMECRDCEMLLQLGIDAFHWLILVDHRLREDMFRHGMAFDPQVQVAIETLCRAWIRPCVEAEKQIAIQLERGYTISNLSIFRECREEMVGLVEAIEDGDEVFPPALSELRDEALREHRNGETADFV